MLRCSPLQYNCGAKNDISGFLFVSYNRSSVPPRLITAAPEHSTDAVYTCSFCSVSCSCEPPHFGLLVAFGLIRLWQCIQVFFTASPTVVIIAHGIKMISKITITANISTIQPIEVDGCEQFVLKVFDHACPPIKDACPSHVYHSQRGRTQ